MKALVGLTAVIVTLSGLSLAVGSTAPDRPPGVAADHWAAISDTLGVVLVPDAAIAPDAPVGGAGAAPGQLPKVAVGPGDRTALYAAPNAAVQAIIEEGHPVRGYLMVRRGKLWRPLTVVAPSVGG